MSLSKFKKIIKQGGGVLPTFNLRPSNLVIPFICIVGFLSIIWAMGFVFLSYIGINPSQSTPLTLFQYIYYYLDHETVREGEPIFIGCDFNVTKQAATIYIIRHGVWHAVDEFVDMYDTPNMIELIKANYPTNRIYIYPDATGKGRRTNNASISDISLLQQESFIVRAKASNPRVRDRIMAMNRALDQRLVRINDSTCPVTAQCLEQQASIVMLGIL